MFSHINREEFFSHVRAKLFSGHMSQGQVDGINSLLNYNNADFNSEDPRWLAYILATVHHETGGKMQPIREEGLGSGHAYGATVLQTGKRYYGRGLVQITWEENYRKLGQAVGIGNKLYLDPDMALKPDVATSIVFVGMTKGLFTGKKLSTYFNDKVDDWFNARRIINGLDKAKLIEEYAKDYNRCLLDSTV